MKFFSKNHKRKPCTIELVKYKGYNGAYARNLETMYIARRIDASGRVKNLMDWMSEGFGTTNLKYAQRNAVAESIAVGWPIVWVDET